MVRGPRLLPPLGEPGRRLVLGIAGHRGRDVEQASDGLCTALQLANFWQDFGVDYRRGRIYLPAEVSGRRRAQEGDLAAGVWTEAWRDASTRPCAGRASCSTRAGRSPIWSPDGCAWSFG